MGKKKVDIEAMIAASGQTNDMSGRAPLAPGFEEDTKEASSMSQVIQTIPPMGPSAPATGGNITDAGYAFMRAEADAENALWNATPPALVAVDAEGKPSAVLVPHVFAEPQAPEAPKAPMTELETLAATVLALTKRLEDFGAIPKAETVGPRVPVVTITKAGNKRTDW